MWPKYLPVVMLAYNTFHSLNLANYSPYELVFDRKPKLLLDPERNSDIKITGTFLDDSMFLKRLQCLYKLFQDFR